MATRPKIGPPKGTTAAANAAAAAAATAGSEEDRIARLSNRYQGEPGEGSGPDWPATRSPTDTTRRGRGGGRRRAEPVGMTRKTYYLTSAAADALDRAVAEVVRATGGTISKHTALGAIIDAGVGQSGAVAQQLRSELMEVLTRQDPAE